MRSARGARADVPSVVIVGGGISGLSTAYYLKKAGIPCTLIEPRGRLGGVITTEVVDGCVVEGGPDSFLAAKPWALELIRELGLAGQVIGSNDHLRATYVLKGGRLVPLPDGLMMMVPTRVLPMVTTRLLGWPTKIRMGLEYFRRGAGAQSEDQSVAEFVEDHYGREAVDYLAEPLLAGVYGGSPEALSVRSVLGRFVELEARYGSLTRGVLAERRKAVGAASGLPLFQTLKGGLGQLITALEEAVRDSVTVVRGMAEALEQAGPGLRVRVGGEWLSAEHVVVACQAYRAGELVESVDSELAGTLQSIPYCSSMTVALTYDRQAVGHRLNGFGFLVPRRERRRLVACTWVGTKFTNRTPDDRALLRCFLGGADDPGILDEPDEAVVALVREELRRTMGVMAEPLSTRLSRWPRSMAQYTVGHERLAREIEERRRRIPGLALAGNAYQGIGIPDCIRMGRDAAREISRTA